VHIIPEANGDNISIENLLLICSGCNKSMGCNEIGEYIKNNYEDKKYENFINRCYILYL